ncbi:hypothetical protein Tco_1176099 [Tanacetum coccineum]
MLPLQVTYAFATLLIMLGNDILIVLDIPTALELPAVSPFLCSDDSESDPESEPVDELPKRHLSLRLYDDVVSKWRDKIATASPACDTLTPVITGSPTIHSRIQTTSRKSTLGLRPVITVARSVALRRTRRVALSSESSSSSSLSGSSSDSTSHTSKSSSTASLRGTQISPEDHSHHSSKAVRSLSGPLTRRRPQCSDYAEPTSSLSARPSRKRIRSSATSIPSTVHTAGALSPARADLIPPYKRYRGTSAIYSYESSDEGSPETHVESDIDSDIRADIKAETAAAATTAVVTVDGLGIEPDIAVVETSFETGLAVVESKSKPEEVEADDEADAEIQPKGTIEIGIDVTTGIAIPNDLPLPDTIEQLEQLEESVQGMYGHMLEIPLQRIEVIEVGQTDQQAKNMIVDGERSSLLERVVALESSNTRLRDALGINRVRADSLQRCLGYVEDEFRQIRELRAYESKRI